MYSSNYVSYVQQYVRTYHKYRYSSTYLRIISTEVRYHTCSNMCVSHEQQYVRIIRIQHFTVDAVLTSVLRFWTLFLRADYRHVPTHNFHCPHPVPPSSFYLSFGGHVFARFMRKIHFVRNNNLRLHVRLRAETTLVVFSHIAMHLNSGFHVR